MLGVIVSLMIGGIVLLVVVRNLDNLLCRYVHVPEGESWRQIYRAMRDKKRDARPSWFVWLVIGGGIGMAAVSLLLEIFK